ncbi:MAG: uracil-DNA glycosylase [Verrucomicrobia bacterium]|nr:uracil-DNA glycosylase [Verrucomicrobiota bacterium]
MLKIEKSWHKQLQGELEKPYIRELKAFLEAEKSAGHSIFPEEKDVFSAFLHTPFDQVKVVLIGQDPYHGVGQAHGLSFSVLPGMPLPPSLKNIYRELQEDLGVVPPQNGYLLHWAKQGVLLLNATLTVRAKDPRSHYGKGWEQFTDAVVSSLLARKDPVIFVLWGKSAQEKLKNIHPPHVALVAAHPSPYSAYSGFFGCRHFSKINEQLKKWGKEPIDWNPK